MGLLDALSYVSETLDKPGRAVRGLAAGRPEELLNLLPMSDSFGLTDPSQSVSGRGLLEQYGMLGENQEGLDFGDVAGVGAEMALDPTNWLGGGLLKKLMGARGAAQANNAWRTEALAKGAMPPEVAALTKAVDSEGKPLKLFHGTGTAFDDYDWSKFDSDALRGKGLYLTDAPDISGEYALNRAEDLAHKKTSLEKMLGQSERSVQRLKDRQADYLINPPENPYMAERLPGEIERYMRQAERERRALAEMPEPAPNIRAHFLDTRNPFDSEGAGAIRYDAMSDGTGYDLDKVNNILWNEGHDTIRYDGGKRIGDKFHNVYVALDPSQVYAPYVAPAEQAVPRLSPLLAALGGYNATTRGY